jgi:hypothetical protein
MTAAAFFDHPVLATFARRKCVPLGTKDLWLDVPRASDRLRERAKEDAASPMLAAEPRVPRASAMTSIESLGDWRRDLMRVVDLELAKERDLEHAKASTASYDAPAVMRVPLASIARWSQSWGLLLMQAVAIPRTTTYREREVRCDRTLAEQSKPARRLRAASSSREDSRRRKMVATEANTALHERSQPQAFDSSSGVSR